MWEGYLQLGGQEILNAARVWGYTQTADCPIRLVHDRPHESMYLALGDDTAYTVEDIESAPWYDPDDEATTRFYGAYPITMDGLSDSTASASSTQRVGAGGIIGRTRESTREIRVRAMLVAEGEDALEAGMIWLKAALAAQDCGVGKRNEIVLGFGEYDFGFGPFGDGQVVTMYEPITRRARCGLTDALFFVAEPPRHPADETVAEYRQRIAPLRRRLYNVKRTSGPLVESKRSTQNGRVFLYTVTFVLESELPWVFSDTLEMEMPPSQPTVVQDAPFNLVPYPSAEIGDTTAIVSTQYATNPSVEVNATDWDVQFETVTGSNVGAFGTKGRVVNELQAVGSASMRGRILGDGATEASGLGRIRIFHDVDCSNTPQNARLSFNIWGAVVNVGGSAGFSVESVRAVAYWRTDDAPISSTVIGDGSAGTAGGRAFSLASVLKPTLATRVRVSMEFVVNWSSSATPAQNSDIRAYADAVAATMP